MNQLRGKIIENVAQAVFTLCAVFAIFATAFIALYMIISGVPAIGKVGWKEILLGTLWAPADIKPRFGILYVILTSLTGTFLAILMGVPAGVLAAIYLAEVSGKRAARVIRSAVELLAGIPSVIYGLLGVYLLNPLMYRLELKIFSGTKGHQFTGGANLLAASMVLAIMILPTVISISETAIRAVPQSVRAASLALGATRMQTIFFAVLPAAKRGITMAVVLGVGRAMGEAMAITLVSGGSVNAPFPFHSVRFLTTAIVSEMAYSQGTHRQMLFTVGLVLLVYIILTNIVLRAIARKNHR